MNDVLDLSKIESNRLRLDEAGFDLPALLAEVAALAGTSAQAACLALVVASQGAPRGVRGDAMRLRELEQEAVKATMARCGGNVSAAARSLRVARATLYRKLKLFGMLD